MKATEIVTLRFMGKFCYILSTELYSALNIKELPVHEKAWRIYKYMLLNEKASRKRLHAAQYD